MIHYHGTPLTPRSALLGMGGKHFCVPFSDGRDADTCLQIGQSVLFDNGKFGAFTRGIEIDIEGGYYPWLEPRLAHPHWAIVPDTIDGPVDEQRQSISTWPFSKTLGAPVWHMGLPIEWLVELAEEWPRICWGSSGRYWQVGNADWCRRADAAFNELSKRHSSLPWIHMLRGMALAGDRWPFASADSINVARNYKDSRTDPERMARRIDSVQCPVKWQLAPQQEVLFA